MIIDKMICKKCGNDSFCFEWRYANENAGLHLALSHDGWGFQFRDSYVCCSKCKEFMEYEKEDFIEIKNKEK